MAPKTSSLRSSPIAADLDGTPSKFLGLFLGLVLLMTPIAAKALDPIIPQADFPASEDCCGTDQDQDHTFRGYTAELWDEAPTVSELDCPNQDEACLLKEADQISRLLRLQQALAVSAGNFQTE